MCGTPKHIAEVVRLKGAISGLGDLPEHTWFYATSQVSAVTFDTLCYICTEDARDFSDEENDLRDTELESAGLEAFLSRQQLEDVLSNANQRALSGKDTERAIDYFVFHNPYLPED